MYPWATKDYILNNMSIGQVILYHNLGMETKYPSPETEEKRDYDKFAQAKKELAAMGLIGAKDQKKVELAEQYGKIE